MRICHITPHLPPDQAANALLPFHLGRWSTDSGDEVVFAAHPPASKTHQQLPGPVEWVPRRDRSDVPWIVRKARGAQQALEIVRRVDPIVKNVDIVHLHSNGLLMEVGARLAHRHHKPTVLTLYGTEIWHYERRHPIDLFTRAYHEAAAVTFYSDRLRAQAQEFGLHHRDTHVIYPPVAKAFSWSDDRTRRVARETLGLNAEHVLLNVKRLHPLAGQRYAIDAMPPIIDAHPNVQLLICGTGSLQPQLEAHVQARGLGPHVRFMGCIDNDALGTYYAAADAFLLPSLLEAGPTVALEALACGTPVISSDNPGGLELKARFGRDVDIVPVEDAAALAKAVVVFLNNKRRTDTATRDLIEEELRPQTVCGRFQDIYVRLANDVER